MLILTSFGNTFGHFNMRNGQKHHPNFGREACSSIFAAAGEAEDDEFLQVGPDTSCLDELSLSPRTSWKRCDHCYVRARRGETHISVVFLSNSYFIAVKLVIYRKL